MSWIDKEYWYIFWVMVVGLIGAVLGLLDENGRPRKNRTKKGFFAAAATSMFLDSHARQAGIRACGLPDAPS